MKNHILRVLTICLALVLVCLLAACGGSDAGYTFKTSGGVEIAIGDAADKTIEALGTYLSMTESASCGGIPGNDRVYAYAGFRVKTTPADGGDVVCQIELTDDSLKTPEGIYIGMNVEDAKTAMSGKGTIETVGEGFSCTKGNTRLQVSARGGIVSGVTYVEA